MLLLGFFSGGDEFANRAGMFAIERFDQRLLQRFGLRITGDHGHPGNRLQEGPVSAQYKRERDDRQPSEQPGGHGWQAIVRTARVNGKVEH